MIENLKRYKNLGIFLLSDVFYYGSTTILSTFLVILITTRITQGRLDATAFVVFIPLFIDSIFSILISNYTNNKSHVFKVRLVGYCYILLGFLVLFLIFCTNLYEVLLIQVGLAFLETTSFPIKWSLFSDIGTKKLKVKSWSYESTVTSFLSGIAVLTSGFIGEKIGINYVFIFVSILYILSGVFFLRIKDLTLFEKVKLLVHH